MVWKAPQACCQPAVFRRSFPAVLLLVGQLLLAWCKLWIESRPNFGHYHGIFYSTCPYGLWRHSKSQLGGPWLYLYILKLHPGCGNLFLLDTWAWKARPRRLHILIKFVSSHACVCMPSVENPVALGLTSGSHRHRASFDFLPSPHSNLLSPRSTNNILQILPHMRWGGGERCFDVGLGSGLRSRSNLYL